MKVKIIGAGLAGSEAAYQLLKNGVEVELFEMRPNRLTPAHKTGGFAELVCSNSLKSADMNTSSGLLKAEMRLMDSLIIACAENCSVPSGSALSVDREEFSREIERRLSGFSNLKIIREEVVKIDGFPQIIATGPLTDGAFMDELQRLTGGALSFFDAAAPIVSAESIDYESAFFASRYGRGGDTDYLNCPLKREEYLNFYRELIAAECAEVKGFEDDAVFSGCMPIEVMAKRGEDTMRFGPMKPVGIYDKNNKRPYAVLQLRRENGSGTMYNLVGFQTHLKFGEQKRVFSLIPALKNAEFLRYGVMHRNSFVDAPKVLDETFAVRLLRLRERWRTARNDYSPKEKGKTIYIAGQLSGVEGYVESAMSGLVAAKNLLNFLVGKPPFGPPATTMTGALCGYIAKENTNFQPMNSNFGLLPPLENDIKDKRKRKEEYSRRAIADMKEYLKEH